MDIAIKLYLCNFSVKGYFNFYVDILALRCLVWKVMYYSKTNICKSRIDSDNDHGNFTVIIRYVIVLS